MIKSFDEVFEDVTKLGVKIKTDEYHPIGKYQIIDQGQEAVAGYSDLEDGVFENVPAIVFGDHTRIVKYVDQPFFLGADGVKVLRSRFKGANYRYLYYALKNMKIPNTGYNRHFKWLKEEKIYYPNSEEQSKIVSILDGISSVIEHRQQELQKLDELVKARFVELFSGKKYDYARVSEVCDFITKGTTPKSDEIFKEYEIGRIPYLKVYNLSLTGDLIFDAAPQYINASTHEEKLARSKVYPNDVLMNIVGPPLGKFALVTNEFDEWNINQAIAIFRAKEKVIPSFLMAALMQPDVLQPFLQQAVGIRQLNLSLEQCRNLEIPLPPLELQQQFAAFVEEVNKSKSAVQKALDEAQLLFDSLMQQYFG